MINGKPSLVLAHYTNLQSVPTPANAAQAEFGRTGATAAAAQNRGDSIIISDAARAGLSEKASATIAEDAQASMKKLLADTGKSSPLKDGKLDVDLSRFDRRELFAVATNSGLQFPTDQQKAAKLELQRRFDVTMAGGLAVVGVTGNVKELYDLALDYLNSAGPEERASGPFQKQLAAVKEALAQLEVNPEQVPSGIANDPVDNYLMRAAKGEAIIERSFADVTSDARRSLDKQYKAADAEGKRLVFSGDPARGKAVDLSGFGNRALSAISLNRDESFSSREVLAAKEELQTRVGKTVQDAFRSSGPTNDPTAFSKNLIAQYQTMSAEEREAAGFSPEYYVTLKQNFESSQAMSQLFAGLGGPSASGSSLNLMSFL